MKKWNKFPIGDILKVTSGGTPSRKKSSNFEGGKIPWVKTGDLKKKYLDKASEYITEEGLNSSSAKLFPKNTVLFAMYGATIGASSILKMEAATNQACAALLPNEKINELYLFYFLKGSKQDLISKGVGGAQPNISGGIIKKTKIPLPPLPIQKQIAELLDTADALRRKTQAQIDQLDELAQSVFLEMFGDPVLNKKEWDIIKFKTILSSIENGWSPVCENYSRTSEEEWAVLKLGAVSYRFFNPKENKVLPESLSILKELIPKKGDLLFSRKNTHYLVGAAAFVFKDFQKLLLPDTIFRLNYSRGKAKGEYLWFLLNEVNFRQEVQRLATGSAASMPNISKAKLKEFEIPLPPLALQTEFASIIENIELQKGQLTASLRESESLFGGLLQEVFG